MSVAASPIAAAFSAHGKRAALMPYLMGGYPEHRRVGGGRARRARTPGPTWSSSGIPFSDPLADGPVIHAAGTAALAAGVDSAVRCSGCASGSRRGCRSC